MSVLGVRAVMMCPPTHAPVLLFTGGDKFAQFATLFITYVVNALLFAKRRGYHLHVDLAVKSHVGPVQGNIGWSTYFEPLSSYDPARCPDNELVRMPDEFWFPRVHQRETWAVRSWYYGPHGDGAPRWRKVYDPRWYERNRRTASEMVARHIHVRRELRDEHDARWLELFGNNASRPSLAVHMRGTDKGEGDPVSSLFHFVHSFFFFSSN